MSLTRRASFAVAAALLLTLVACSPTVNRNAAGNGNSPPPAANANSANANAANANAAKAARKSKPGTGTLEITSVPTGAGITVMATSEDSAGPPQAYGPTPATINDLAPGKYTVTLHQNGYKEFRREVEVKADNLVQVNATLKR